MDKLILILLVAFSATSFSHWWVAAVFVDRYAFIYLLLVAIFQGTILCSLFQAGRTLANETYESGAVNLTGRFSGWFFAAFLIGCFITAAVLASHNLVVLSWQLNAIQEIVTNSYRLVDFSLLLMKQNQVFGGLGEQMLWLIIAAAIGVLCSYCVYGRFRQRLAPIWLICTLVVFLLFFMLFFWQHDIDIIQPMQARQYVWSDLALSSLTMAVEPSLAGFGIFFAFRSIVRRNLEHSFMIFGIALALVLSLLLALGGMLMAQEAGNASLDLTADNLILLTPLYMDSLPASNLTMMLWTIFSIMLAAIKTALLSGVCLFIFSRYIYPSSGENTIIMPLFAALIAVAGLLLSNLTTGDMSFDLTILLKNLYVTFFYLWMPIQLAMMCLLAFYMPAYAHSKLLPIDLGWLANPLRRYYMVLALLTMFFWLYRVSDYLLYQTV